jgi:myosin protein heavy chain
VIILQLLKLVESIYSAKIIADAVDDSQENERQNMCEFMYDFMLNSYGLKGLAESAVHGVFKRIKQLMITKAIDKHHRVRKQPIIIIIIIIIIFFFFFVSSS